MPRLLIRPCIMIFTPGAGLHHHARRLRTGYRGELMTSFRRFPGYSGSQKRGLARRHAPGTHRQQSIDGEYMQDGEYDHFIEDTTDFIVRRYLPRVYTALGASVPASAGKYGNESSEPAYPDAGHRRNTERSEDTDQKPEKSRPNGIRLWAGFNADLEALGFPPFGA